MTTPISATDFNRIATKLNSSALVNNQITASLEASDTPLVLLELEPTGGGRVLTVRDASNTGCRTSTTAWTGGEEIDVDDTVVEGKHFTGETIRIRAARVVLRDCIFDLNGKFPIDGDNASCEDMLVEYCTIDGGGTTAGSFAVLVGEGGIVQFCDITGVENAWGNSGNACDILDNYVHDLQYYGPDPHTDGFQSGGCTGPINIIGNTIYGRDTSNIILKPDFSNISNVNIKFNYLLLHPGDSVAANIYVWSGTIGGVARTTTNVVIEDNVIQIGNTAGGVDYGDSGGPSSITSWARNINYPGSTTLPKPS